MYFLLTRGSCCCCCCCYVASVVSDFVRSHRRQPTRSPRPWDSPGKNTGVGCHFLLQCMKVKSESEVTQSCPALRDPMDCSLPGSSAHGIFQARVLEWVAVAFSKLLVPTSYLFHLFCKKRNMLIILVWLPCVGVWDTNPRQVWGDPRAPRASKCRAKGKPKVQNLLWNPQVKCQPWNTSQVWVEQKKSGTVQKMWIMIYHWFANQ